MTDQAEGTWHKSACILCENNCGIQIRRDGRRFAKIRGDKDHVATGGYTCNKALRLDHYQNGGTRLTTPLRREADGSFTAVDWDTAMREIAARLTAVRDTHGGETIFFYGGGGQGNHLGGAYSGALMRALGARYRSNPLAQEKTGEGWVDAHLTGGHTVGDFEHAEVSVFLGKNPWQSHGVPRARTVLKEIAKDPARTMIVIDPVRTETADLADIHLQVRPGTDAWCLAAILGILAAEDLIDHAFLDARTTQAEQVLPHLKQVDVARCAEMCGLQEDLLRTAARRIGTASSVSTYEDLGVQQGPNSTLVSYLNKLIWLLTGNFAKPGAMQPHSWIAPLARYDTRERRTPVTGARMPGGLVPCNVIAEEILTKDPKRFRAMIIESANPAHSLADSTAFRAALAALDLVVVIDVALTETGLLADYVLPASSQFEKWEATFFTFEFPRNTFHLRAPVLESLPGTLPEPEIYARLIRELNAVARTRLAVLRTAARLGRTPFKLTFVALAAMDKNVVPMAPYLLYETLGPTLPDGARSAAVLWALAQRVGKDYPQAMRRAGHANADALFDAMLAGRSGVTFTLDEPEDAWRYVPHPGHRIPLPIPELLDLLDALEKTPAVHTTDDFPFVLAAGQRRAFTANAIFRTTSWRLRDAGGTLRLNPQDAQRLGLSDGSQARITTTRGSAQATVEIDDRMQPGHAALPNGFGLDLPTEHGTERTGVALNTLTDLRRRDPIAGTPWHKHVPANIEPLPNHQETP
ncbi:anaerobic selenocysteine-containing dehydrogenase [Kibdelosporangium banguiense]|uniref:Anaerobic selenocysteine-containing dehydrogenase n=1 Tax=Kibdelosporangium banguiense TaxID=1365924 RepID=A0ABS4TVE6_9PSEU|nr:molybdopterin-dependent oxidoreductase [Kibdelosporangium banguiense]MBP2328381.1 anaerobic selenocysteine-containing dehydrogenase [Kibdelosporangium banguiense]